MNWGYKLMITFVVFAVMMVCLVYRCFQSSFELVEKEYYKSELIYQQVIDETDNANILSARPAVTQSGNSIVLKMPEEMRNEGVSGTVLFYCASDSGKDKKFNLSVDNSGTQVFSDSLKAGKYTVKISWSRNGKKYYAEQNLIII